MAQLSPNMTRAIMESLLERDRSSAPGAEELEPAGPAVPLEGCWAVRVAEGHCPVGRKLEIAHIGGTAWGYCKLCRAVYRTSGGAAVRMLVRRKQEPPEDAATHAARVAEIEAMSLRPGDVVRLVSTGYVEWSPLADD